MNRVRTYRRSSQSSSTSKDSNPRRYTPMPHAPKPESHTCSDVRRPAPTFMAMASNEGERAGNRISLEIGVNEGSIPPDSETLCEFCKRLPLREVGLNRSSTHFADYRHVLEILKDSNTCPFCREVARFYNEWNCKTFGKKVPNVDRPGARFAHNMVHFQLHKERHAINISPNSDYGTASVNRIWVWFIVSKPFPDIGYFRPVLQFQKCSQPPLQVSNGGSLCNWESGEGQAYSGRIRPVVAEVQLFRKWKETCGATHGGHCSTIYSGTRPTWLRLIDVKERCVVDTRDFKSYAALSYVWGGEKLFKCGKQMPKLTKATENDFRKPGSLSRERILSTIDDAIEVSRGLGEDYIWVDCLCIMQDNKDDQIEFIRQMDSIYGYASVTIVAASGADADAGLPGIKPNSRTLEPKSFCTIKGVSLLRTLDPVGSKDRNPDQYHYLEDSLWLTRGWTFQEKIFSTKLLIFTEEQAYWECQKATWCEDSLWETTQSSTVYRPCFSKDLRRPWPSDANGLGGIYKKLVFEYTRRSLTYQNDGLDAFEGVLNTLRRETDQGFLWALPTSFLSSSLTWSCGKQPTERRSRCSMRSSDRAIECPFPSWSWVGWNAMVLSFLPQTYSDLVFYTLNSERQLHRVGAADGTQSMSSLPTGPIAESLFSHPNAGGHIGRTDVIPEEIPQGVFLQSIASNILFFWSSTAKVHVCHSDGEWVEVDEPILIHNHEDVDICDWAQTPALDPGCKEPAELVVIGGDSRSVFAVLLVYWKDGVAYRRGLATIIASKWFMLGPIWKMISLG